MSIDPETVTLANGDLVAEGSLVWREENRARARHVETLLHIGSLQARRQYIADVAHREGAESARRLQAQLARSWEERKRAEEEARAQLDAAHKVGP